MDGIVALKVVLLDAGLVVEWDCVAIGIDEVNDDVGGAFDVDDGDNELVLVVENGEAVESLVLLDDGKLAFEEADVGDNVDVEIIGVNGIADDEWMWKVLGWIVVVDNDEASVRVELLLAIVLVVVGNVDVSLFVLRLELGGLVVEDASEVFCIASVELVVLELIDSAACVVDELNGNVEVNVGESCSFVVVKLDTLWLFGGEVVVRLATAIMAWVVSFVAFTLAKHVKQSKRRNFQIKFLFW